MKQKHMFSLLDQTFTTVHVHIHGDKAPIPQTAPPAPEAETK